MPLTKWSDCPYGKAMLGIIIPVMLVIVGLLALVTRQLGTMGESQTDIRERLQAVETNVIWLCRTQGQRVSASDPALPNLPN